MLSKSNIKVLKYLLKHGTSVEKDTPFDITDFTDLVRKEYVAKTDVTLPHLPGEHIQCITGYKITKNGEDALEIHRKNARYATVTLIIGIATLVITLVQFLLTVLR